MTRTIVVGDVHGCADELDALLARVAFVPGNDRLVLVGDLVARGPDAPRVIATCLRLGARAVRGNHEARLLQWRAREHEPFVPANDPAGAKPLAEHVVRAARALDETAWTYLEALPLCLELPEHDLAVVHAGLVPGIALAAQDPRTLLYVRTLGAAGEPLERRDAGTPWGARYRGPPHVAFGHNALSEPQLHPWATGLDTGCVYGGRLTALVLAAGERVPREVRARVLVSVGARRAYAPIDKGA